MEDFRQAYLRLCKEGGAEPQESVVAQLQESRAGQGSRLDLSGHSLSADTCSVLARAFQNDTGFTEVVLSDCMLSEEGVYCVSLKIDTQPICTVVWFIKLYGNNLRSTGAEVLGKLLARNNTLRRLVLEWNALGVWDEAFSLFCDGLASNSVLTQLDLRNNQINHHGASELALALKRNTTVQVLDLRWNNIGLLGGRTLLEALQKNHSIVQLEMAGNNIPSDTLKALEQTTGHNSDRQSTLRESRSRTQVLSKEIQTLKEEKGRLQMTEAALTLSEQKNHNMGELLTRVKAEKEEQRERQSRERKKEQEVEEKERRCKSQQQQIFELKQELTNSTAELKLQLTQAEDRLEMEKRRSKQALQDMDTLRQKEVEHMNRHLEESERALQERIFKLEGQRIQLEEELSKAKAACVTERAQAEEELGRVRAQVRLEEQELVSGLEEKLRSVRSNLQEVQLHCSQQKQTISELQAKNSQQGSEINAMRRRTEELQQDLSAKDQEKVAEVSRVKVELLEQIGHLQAERTAQGGLKEKISALEREIKVLSSNHREVLLDKESEMSSMLEKLRLKEAEIQRMREDEANRASYLQSAILTYVQGSPLGHYNSPKK
uniref:Leucine rich repeat containing 45 n=1 Tax=Sander lucioperca TaxID=283035 RepID=A0A8D0DCS4_SANLU